ncbi:MAG: hypothetical protein AABW88_00850 [Nanoarchaeota archaeon]
MKHTVRHAFTILTYYGLTEVGQKEVDFIKRNFDETYKIRINDKVNDESERYNPHRMIRILVEVTSELYQMSIKELPIPGGIASQLMESRKLKFSKAHERINMSPRLLESIINDPKYSKKLPLEML